MDRPLWSWGAVGVEVIRCNEFLATNGDLLIEAARRRWSATSDESTVGRDTEKAESRERAEKADALWVSPFRLRSREIISGRWQHGLTSIRISTHEGWYESDRAKVGAMKRYFLIGAFLAHKATGR